MMTLGARSRIGAVVAALVTSAACSGYDTPTSPTTQPTASAAPASATRAPLSYDLFVRTSVRTAAGLSGLVFETTPSGPVPIPGVSVYCDACGEEGHTTATTDASGFYRFSGDIDGGGGVWLSPGFTTYLIVNKDGYQDPTGLPPFMWGDTRPGWREVMMSGETRFDIELVRRR